MTALAHLIYGLIIASLLAWLLYTIRDRNRVKQLLNRERLISNHAIYLRAKEKNRKLSGKALSDKSDALRERIKHALRINVA